MATKLRANTQIMAGTINEALFDTAFVNRMSGLDTSIANLQSNKADLTYVDTRVAEIIDAAPEALNTLNELAAALGDDPNFATSITTELGTKATQTALDGEVSRATAAEGALSGRLDVVEGDALTEGSIAKSLADAKAYTDAETTRASNAESTLSGRLDVVEGDASVEGSVAKALADAKAYTDTETSRATSAESALDGRVTAIETDNSIIRESDIVRGATFVETPDGTRLEFTLVSGDVMRNGTVQVIVNGLEAFAGASEDFIVNPSRTGIIFNSAPQTGDKLRAHYFKE